MPVITFFNEKGGEGKTTISCHYAAWLKSNGKKVLFIDSCRQANSSNFFDENVSNIATSLDFFTKKITSIDDMDFVCLTGETMKINIQNINRSIVESNIQQFKKMGFEYIIFDTSPALSTVTIAIFVVSDGIFCPTHLHNFSYKGINKTVETIAKINTKNGSSTKLLGIIPNDITPGSKKQKEELGKIIIAHAEKVMPPLLNRKPFSDVMNGNTPIWGIKPQAGNIKTATKEMYNLMSALDEKIKSEAA